VPLSLLFLAPIGLDRFAIAKKIAELLSERRKVRQPPSLFQTRVATGGLANLVPQYAVSRDGRFLINTRLDDSGIMPIVLILNSKSATKK